MAVDTEQLKVYLKLAIKHRFWIAVGLAALLPMIGYFVGSGPIKKEGTAKAAEVKGADDGVKKYMSGPVKNRDWTQVVTQKTDVLNADVNASWRILYNRQAPLLTWPTSTAEPLPFKEWGRTYPEDVDPATVQVAVGNYIAVYDAFVDEVYKTVRPWDPETGKGVVVTPGKEGLLQPAQFDPDNPPTDLNKIWSAQEKLWVQRGVLEVVDKVNKNAKDWDSAVIKQILQLQVANDAALDQVSAAKGEALKETEPLKSATEAAASAEGAGGLSAGAASAEAGGYSGMQGGQMGGGTMMAMRMGRMMGGGMMGGMGAAKTDTVSYLNTDSKQFNIAPIMLQVLMDQNYINDLLVEMANSPMAILVIDYEQQRPAQRVQKPVKGDTSMMSAGGYGGMMGAMMGRMMGGSMFNYGGGAGGPGGMGGYGGMMGRMGGYGGMMGGAASKGREGKSLRDRDIEKEKQKKAEELEKREEVRIHDPYFNIVQVTLYGQARFYLPPPAEAETQAEAPAAAEETQAEPGEAEKAEAKEGEQPEAKADANKADEKKADETKADTKADAAEKADQPEADEKKADATKAGEAKDDEPAQAEPARDAGDPKAADAAGKAADRPQADAKDAAPKR